MTCVLWVLLVQMPDILLHCAFWDNHSESCDKGLNEFKTTTALGIVCEVIITVQLIVRNAVIAALENVKRVIVTIIVTFGHLSQFLWALEYMQS